MSHCLEHQTYTRRSINRGSLPNTPSQQAGKALQWQREDMGSEGVKQIHVFTTGKVTIQSKLLKIVQPPPEQNVFHAQRSMSSMHLHYFGPSLSWTVDFAITQSHFKFHFPIFKKRVV